MFGKVLRIVGIVLMGITAVFNLLGGVGTSCVAIDATRYESMIALADFQWLYILYVVAGVVLGIMGIVATRALIKGKSNAYRLTMITLALSLVVGVVHILTSRALRGSSMPVDAVVYVTALTLVVFLLFRIPGIWNKVNLSRPDDHTSGLGAGVAMIVAGAIVLTVHIWAGPTHTINGVNYADVWRGPLMIIGWGLALAGAALLGRYTLTAPLPEERPSPVALGEPG